MAGLWGSCLLTLVFCVALLTATVRPVNAQTRPAWFDTPATIRVIGTPHSGERLPLLIVLPPTGDSATNVFAAIAPRIALERYVVMLPEGVPARSDYARDFDRFLGWFDARLTADIATARTRYPIDPQRIVVIGFSLGGDLAWALIGRHADLYRGAFVMGSHCASPVGARALSTLRASDARVVLAIGTLDNPSRVHGLTNAFERLQHAHVASQMFRFPGAHELPTDPDAVSRAFHYLFDR